LRLKSSANVVKILQVTNRIEVKETFKLLQKHLYDIPLLSNLSLGNDHYMYPATSEVFVSAVLLKDQNRKWILSYFVNHVLTGPKLIYPNVKKLVQALITIARNWGSYFEAHSDKILTY